MDPDEAELQQLYKSNKSASTDLEKLLPLGHPDTGLTSRQKDAEENSTQRLAVIFTTLTDTPQKLHLYTNAIKNWATFLPKIQPLLFYTNPNSTLIKLAEQHGWLALPAPKVNKFQVPFLKDMYMKAYDIEKAVYYAFINGDILFDDSLVTTLQRIGKNLPEYKATLVSGRRRRYNVNCTTSLELWKQSQVREAATPTIPTLDRVWALDFFFVTRDFPWHGIKDVVIGRIAYDNYLVARSINMDVTTIDVSRTVSALHLCEHTRDRLIGKQQKPVEDLWYNKQLIEKEHKFEYERGFAYNMLFFTYYDEQGTMKFMRRAD